MKKINRCIRTLFPSCSCSRKILGILFLRGVSHLPSCRQSTSLFTFFPYLQPLFRQSNPFINQYRPSMNGRVFQPKKIRFFFYKKIGRKELQISINENHVNTDISQDSAALSSIPLFSRIHLSWIPGQFYRSGYLSTNLMIFFSISSSLFGILLGSSVHALLWCMAGSAFEVLCLCLEGQGIFCLILCFFEA